MRIVVTGGAGYIGRRLVARLRSEGHETVCYDVVQPPAPTGKFVRGDVQDVAALSDAMSGADVVMHLAGGVAGTYRRDPWTATRVQHAGSLAVLESAERTCCAHVLLASSFYVYRGREGDCVGEDDALDTREMGLFGATKLMSEKLLQEHCERTDQKGTVLRFGSAYGGDDSSNAITGFLEVARAGQNLVVWGDGERLNQYTHVDDIVDGCVRSLGGPAATFNLVSPETTSTMALATLIAEPYGVDVSLDRTKPDGPRMPFISSHRAVEQLGWQPRSLRQGLKENEMTDAPRSH